MTTQYLHILNDNEIKVLYAAPEFNATERSHFFTLPSTLLKDLKIKKTNGRNTSAKLYFILQYGYFKARHQFFNVHYKEIKEDVAFVMAHYFPRDVIPQQLPTRKIQRSTKTDIMKYMEFKECVKDVDRLVLEKTHQLAKTTPDIMTIFEGILHALEKEKLLLPKYSRFQNKIGSALKSYQHYLNQQVKQQLKQHVKKSLDNLLKMKDDFYAITTLKFDAKSFQTKEMTADV